MCENTRLSYLHNVGKEPLKPYTLGNILEMAAVKFKNNKAVVAVKQNQSITYKELLEAADTFAAGLHVLGINKGDLLGIWAPNLIEWIVVNMACVRAGIIMVAMNSQNQGPELKYCLNKVGVKVLVCPQCEKYQDYYRILHEIIPNLEDSNPKKLNCQEIPSLDFIVMLSEESLSGTLKYQDVFDLANEAEIFKIKNSQHLIQPDEPCYIQFSSGTTGQPKAAVASHFQVTNSSFEIGQRNELNRKHHIVCVQLPLFHVFGTTVCLAASIHFGSTMVLVSPTYSPMDNLQTLLNENCTLIYGTPTMFIDLINVQKQLQLELRTEIAVIGGAPCTAELSLKIKNILYIERVKNIYASTESSGVAFQSLPIEEEESAILSTVGHLCDHMEAKVIDPNGSIVPMGQMGQLCIRGYSVMLGYWKDEEKTKEIIGWDGWMKTGDQFILQENGYGRIAGRLKDMIIRGGENIFPKEVEDVLVSHPDIIDATVIGLPHERLGEEVCACLRVKAGSDITQQSLAKFLQGKIAFCKIPSQVRIIDEFPITVSGKVVKHELKRQFSINGN